MEPSYVGIRQHLKIVRKFCKSSKFTNTYWLRFRALKAYARKFGQTKATIFACIREIIRS
jgi:hypothetical protein